MYKNIPQKILISTLIITLIVSLGFLTGFTYPDGSINKDIVKYNDGGSEEQSEEEDELEGEETAEENDREDEEVEEEGQKEDGTEYWVCGECRYVYNPEEGDPESGIEAGTEFEDLPDDWVCPVCGASKDEFEFIDDDESNGQIKEQEEWLARLEHVLEMRFKHIMVLQRVIEKMISKDPLHPSIPALQHALQSSSKSIQKAQEVIGQYNGYLGNSDDTNDNSDEANNNSYNTNNNSDKNNTGLENRDGNGKTIDGATTQGKNSKENKGNGKGKNKVNKGKGKNK